MNLQEERFCETEALGYITPSIIWGYNESLHREQQIFRRTEYKYRRCIEVESEAMTQQEMSHEVQFKKEKKTRERKKKTVQCSSIVWLYHLFFFKLLL